MKVQLVSMSSSLKVISFPTFYAGTISASRIIQIALRGYSLTGYFIDCESSSLGNESACPGAVFL